VKVYPLGLAGERNYQQAIRNCRQGEPARIFHEHDNPHDSLALRVENDAGDVIGYVPRESWLRHAIHEEGRGCAASIKSIANGGGSILGVVIDVTLTDDPVFERNYQQPSPLHEPKGNDALVRFMKALFR